jgi:hypothetical protein
MRNLGAMILIGFLLAVGLTAFLLWGPLGEKPGMREMVQESEESPSGSKAPKAASSRSSREKVGKSWSGGGESSEVPAASVQAQLREQPLPNAASTPPRRFPTAADIPAGMQKSQLEAAFGTPTMQTTAVDRGMALETFVYLRSDPNTATFILLKSGRVVSANTTIY